MTEDDPALDPGDVLPFGRAYDYFKHLTGIALVFWASGVVLSLGAYASRLAPPIAPAIAPTIKPAAKDK